RRPPQAHDLLDAHDRGRVGPQLLELIILALGRGEDVDHNVAIVEKHPARAGCPLAAGGPPVGLVAQVVDDRVLNGGDLPLAGAAADHEVVSQERYLAEIEQYDVTRLAVGCNIDDLASDLLVLR